MLSQLTFKVHDFFKNSSIKIKKVLFSYGFLSFRVKKEYRRKTDGLSWGRCLPIGAWRLQQDSVKWQKAPKSTEKPL